MKKQFFLMTMLSLFPVGLQCAQPVATKTAGQLIKHYAKKTISGTMTGLHWTIAAGAPVYTGLKRANALLDEKKFFATLDNADENTTQFIMDSLSKTYNKKIDAVKIDNSNGMPMATLNKHIIIPSSTANEITTALNNNDQTTLNKWRGTLEHEANHIKNNDFVWRSIIDIASPFVTHGSVKVIRNALPIAKKTRSFLGEQLIKIPTAIGKAHITSNTRMAIYRHQEQRADDGVSHNLDALNGIKEVINETEKQNIKLLNAVNLSPKQLTALRWANNFYEMHPLPAKRIEKINQRIALLEKQSHNNNNNA